MSIINSPLQSQTIYEFKKTYFPAKSYKRTMKKENQSYTPLSVLNHNRTTSMPSSVSSNTRKQSVPKVAGWLVVGHDDDDDAAAPHNFPSLAAQQ